MSDEKKTSFEQWCVVELMGHLRLAGIVTEEEHFGSKLGRIDVPTTDGGFVTQYFHGNSIYRVRPVSEEVARAVAAQVCDRPVQQWELPKSLPAPAEESAFLRRLHEDDEFEEDDR